MLADCQKCKGANGRLVRQSMGCGFEVESKLAIPWDHRGRKSDPPVTCAGYTTRMPEVIEILRARRHWEKGQLALACDEAPHENALIAIEILEGSSIELQNAKLTPISKGGLAEG